MGHAETGALPAGQQSERSRAGTEQLTPADQVSTLHRLHGMDLVRIAAVMLGSRRHELGMPELPISTGSTTR
jgi:hypothetical protein